MNIGQKLRLNFTLTALFFLQACVGIKDYYELPGQVSETTVNAVIEIPAGTNKKYEYDSIKKEFIIDTEHGVERVIDFLPYPANYGFIPSTFSNPSKGGDGDALDIIVLSEAVPTGTVIETLPIAILKLIDKGEIDYKIVAVPKSKKDRILDATTYAELVDKYPKLLEIIALWFLNYNLNDSSTIEGWGDEKVALQEIILQLKN